MNAGQRLHGAVPGDWADEGACKGKGDVMVPAAETIEAVEAARAICRGCPVRQPCLDFAVANQEPMGIWGGKTRRQRRRIAAGVPA